MQFSVIHWMWIVQCRFAVHCSVFVQCSCAVQPVCTCVLQFSFAVHLCTVQFEMQKFEGRMEKWSTAGRLDHQCSKSSSQSLFSIQLIIIRKAPQKRLTTISFGYGIQCGLPSVCFVPQEIQAKLARLVGNPRWCQLYFESKMPFAASGILDTE